MALLCDCCYDGVMQLIARGILLPEEPSCESVAASDLDFSNLSLDSGMDRLSRLADSLVEGVTPGGFGAPCQDTKAGDSFQGIASREGRGQIGAASTAQRPTAAGSAETRGSQDDTSAAAAAQAPSQHQPAAASDAGSRRARSDVHIGTEAYSLKAESASRPSWLQTGTDNQTGNTGGSIDQMSHGASQMPGHVTPESVQLSDAPSPAYAQTASLCQHSLPANLRIGATSASEDEQAALSQLKSRVVAVNGKTGRPAASQSNAVEHFDSAAEASFLASVSASESASPQSGDPYPELHDQSGGHPSSCEDCSESEIDSHVSHCASSSLHEQQQEGLLSDSENECEQSLLNARMLRPTNTSQAAAR